ncbi:MAG: formylglycine-generating enzyme family protein [Nitrospinota bacterium]
MVKIPGGEFKSGPDKKISNVKEFYIDKFEVPFFEFHKFDKTIEVPEGKGSHPVSEISYFAAEAYCKSLGKRLPTRLEWEKAARGDDGRKYPWGNKFDAEKANTLEANIGNTVPISSHKNGQSPYGVMNMSGNVIEWVNEWDGPDKKYRLQIGGSYFDNMKRSTVFSTLKSIPDDTHPYTGFRCAK